MKSIENWIEEYGESHQNSINKGVHWICVPLIMLSLLALIDQIPFPFSNFGLGSVNGFDINFNWTILFLLYCVLFYFRLSKTLAIGMFIVALVMIYLITLIKLFDPSIWKLSIVIFVVAWIGQFIGHKIEGKKPSFFQDLKFLLIGPAWLLSFIYKKIGIKL